MNQNDDRRLIGYFGFGSLVNRHTLLTDYVSIVPATLKGWGRHWQAHANEAGRDVALLSVHEDAALEIKGAIIVDHRSNLPEVDDREHGYSRVKLTQDNFLLEEEMMLPDELYVYVADGEDRAEDLPLLQSYLDAVLQGFHDLYGPEGIDHFVATTKSFNRRMVLDRNNPRYPRAVNLTPEQMTLADQALGSVIIVS